MMDFREGHRGLRALLAALAAAGFAISAYLAWTHVSGAAPVCVGNSDGCETIQTSRYSEILGVPVAALGLFAYATMLVCAVLRGEGAAILGVFLALIGVLFSAYLTYLDLFVIRAICQWCMANVAAVIAYLVFGTVRLRLAGSDALKTADRR
jgi:uncharacterized membrane protein